MNTDTDDFDTIEHDLEVKSWCGLVEGSGQAHLVTPEGTVLVDQGFV
jgi:hypothetical protein